MNRYYPIFYRIFFFLFLIVIFLFPWRVFAVSCEDTCSDKSGAEKLTCLAEVKNACQSKLSETGEKKRTLQGTITFLDNKIGFTQSQINQTEYQIEKLKDEISALAGKINNLDLSLDEITALLTNRVKESYKSGRVSPVHILLASNGSTDFIARYKYFQSVKENDRKAMYELEKARVNYDREKLSKEEKQEKVLGLQENLVSQKEVLSKQQSEKQNILAVTKNDEKYFESLLSKANAEISAIQAIIAGKGDETLAGQVKEGDKIAGIIPGASACSNGAHLHFEVVQNKAHVNPASYLSPKAVSWNNSPDGQIDFSGSWRWPLNDSIRITQGYGMTFYAATMKYYGGGPHTGIDMINNADYSVMAVKAGTLYQGAINCGGGRLKYVRVKHDDSLSTFYLHVNYY